MEEYAHRSRNAGRARHRFTQSLKPGPVVREEIMSNFKIAIIGAGSIGFARGFVSPETF